MRIEQPSPTQIITLSRVLGALDVSQAIFVADQSYQLSSVNVVWGVAGGAGATITIEKLTGTTAPGSGTALLTGALDLTVTANTVTAGTLTSTAADLLLASGNRLGIKLAGVLTGLVGCCVTATLRRL